MDTLFSAIQDLFVSSFVMKDEYNNEIADVCHMGPSVLVQYADESIREIDTLEDLECFALTLEGEHINGVETLSLRNVKDGAGLEVVSDSLFAETAF